MRVCDLTQFYSPVSGGVKRYLAEKSRFLETDRPDDEHIVIVPGECDECVREGRRRFYTIRSPLLSRVSQYRLLWRLEAIEEILERERPDVIESGDPYQIGWKAAHSGRGLGIPVIGFYHSHFPEAYLRPAQRWLGRAITDYLVDFSRRYVRSLYNRFACTLVPSPALAELLTGWGVRHVVSTDLGVDAATFFPSDDARARQRRALKLGASDHLLLYVGRLAAEKNTATLFAAFRLLAAEHPTLRLLVIGDGLQRAELEGLRRQCRGVQWIPYCGEPARLADYYRAADLFVHPGLQETFGLVTLEAQGCGTRVTGIRGSYMDRIIHDSQQSWARENSPAALAAAILASLQVETAETRAERARAIATQYSWTWIFQRLFDLYAQVIAEYRPHRS